MHVRRRAALPAILAALAVASACVMPEEGIDVDPQIVVRILDAEGHEVAPSQPALTAPIVRVTNVAGVGQRGIPVNFVVTNARGNVLRGMQTTDSLGFAALDRWSETERSGEYTLVASAPNVVPARLTFRARSAKPRPVEPQVLSGGTR
jgi:hypothetical protein